MTGLRTTFRTEKNKSGSTKEASEVKDTLGNHYTYNKSGVMLGVHGVQGL